MRIELDGPPSSLTELKSSLTTASIIRDSNIPVYFGEHPLITLVFDSSRRIVYANRRARELVGEAMAQTLIGSCIGQALSCIHATESEDGCGTGPSCRFCPAHRSLGAAIRALEDLQAEENLGLDFAESPFPPPGCEEEECGIIRSLESAEGGESSIDLKLWTRPIVLQGQGLVLVTATDNSAEKRREVLERVFYHDIANTASGMRTILELMNALDGPERESYLGLLKSATEQLVEEIESQRALKAAETRELAARFEILDGLRSIQEVLALFAYKLEGKDIGLKLAPESTHVAVDSDPTLLRRVLVNMIKNAIEAAVRGEILLVGVQAEDDQEGGPGWAVFWVKNSAVMPEVARRRVFHRSFSTKGPGRGVGTYSMRLLAEGYLRGKVTFSSKEGEGTVFELRIPRA